MIFVTGATGLLGSHLLFELLNNNKSVRALYRSEDRKARVQSVFNFLSQERGPELFSRIEWIKGDINDIQSLEEGMRGCDQVYHAAALVSFDKRDFHQLVKINREGTTNVVNCALALGIKKLAHISSTAAIGGTEGTVISEETKWQMNGKNTAYALSKYGAEREVWRGIEEGLDAVIINPSVIFGAGSWLESSMTIFRTVNKGLKFYSPGQNCFVDARDVATCTYRLMESELKNDRFLCFSENVPFKQLTAEIARQMGKKVPSIATKRWMASLAWRLAKVVSWFTRKRPTLTKETAASAFAFKTYTNKKITAALDYEFIPIKEVIANAINGRMD